VGDGGKIRAEVPPDPGQRAKRAHPAPSGKELTLLASRRFKNYARHPQPIHEPGGLYSRSEKGRSPGGL
jgi:hypothetical protein